MSPVRVSTIGAYIREQREQAKISLRQLARAAGISNPYLSQIERGLRRPSADILQQIARGLRISAEALYVQAGFLEERAPMSPAREAILRDRDLTDRQKHMLVEIYDSFRRQPDGHETGQPDQHDQAELLWPDDLSPEASANPAARADQVPSGSESR